MKLSLLIFAATLATSNLAGADILQVNSKDLHLKFSGIAESNGVPQHITLVDSGIAALQKRLDMIENAKHTIDVQYFIYNIDHAGRLFTQALIRKAQQGVKIRMMIDTSSAVFRLNNVFVDEISRDGGVDKVGKPMIEVKYYNRDSFIDIVAQNFRAHRKLIVVDNQSAVTGGRNMADEYFGLSPRYNFLDSDIFVTGSLVSQMTIDFEDFWDSPLASLPGTPVEPSPPGTHRDTSDYDARMNAIAKFRSDLVKAHEFSIENDSDRELLKQIKINGDLALEQTAYEGECNNLVYVADHPGLGVLDGTRVLSQKLRDEVHAQALLFQTEKDTAAQGELMIESPYFIPNTDMYTVVNDLKSANIKLRVLTNSLNSTDAFYTVASFNQRIVPLLQKGVEVSIYDGSPASNLFTAEPRSQTADWGTHSKRGVMGNMTIVGTFNIDPRSNNINAEMALICRDNKEAAAHTKASIEERMKHAVTLDQKGYPSDGRPLKFGASFLKIAEYWISYPFTIFLSFLM